MANTFISLYLLKLSFHRLRGCLLTETSCSILASTLNSNSSHLKKLDISFNHPGEMGIKLLSAKVDDPASRLEKLKYVDRNGNNLLLYSH